MSQVWCADDTDFGDLIVISTDNLIVDRPEEEDARSIRDALLQGKTPASVISSDADNIPLVSVTRISADLTDKEIEIEYKKGKETEEKTLHLANDTKRDEVFAALKNVYGDKFEEFEDKHSIPQAVYAPLMSLTIFGFLTWIFAMAAGQLAESYEPDSGESTTQWFVVMILDVIGPVGVWIVGGFLCLMSALAVISKFRYPPQMRILQETPYKSQSIFMTVGKYAILFVMWAYLLRVAWVWN